EILFIMSASDLFHWAFWNLGSNECGNFLMILIRISHVIFVTQLIEMLQILAVLLKKRMAMQPMCEKLVKRGKTHFPLLMSHTYRHRVTPYHNEVAVREHCLQKTRFQEIPWGLFPADPFV